MKSQIASLIAMAPTSSKLLAVVAAAALVGGAWTTRPAHAQAAKDVCSSVRPAKVLTLSSDKSSVKARTASRKYGSGLCKRFVVDVDVQHHPSGHRLVIDGGPTLVERRSESWCKLLNAEVTFCVKKAGRATFSRIGGGKLVGQWSTEGPQRGCSMKKTSSFKDPGQRAYPAKGKTHTYRIAVSAKYGTGRWGERRPVRVEAGARDFVIPK